MQSHSVIVQMASAANIVETAASTGQFNTLLAAAKAAGLAGALADGQNYSSHQQMLHLTHYQQAQLKHF